VALDEKDCGAGAMVMLAGEMGETVTLVGVTVQDADAVAPLAPVTVRVKVLEDLRAAVV